jgi:hypothetical protein
MRWERLDRFIGGKVHALLAPAGPVRVTVQDFVGVHLFVFQFCFTLTPGNTDRILYIIDVYNILEPKR